MKTTITGVITYKKSLYEEGEDFHFQHCEMKDYGYITVMPHSIEVEIPDDFDPRACQVDLLKAEKVKLIAAFQKRCTEIERQISELTALTFEAAT